MRTTFNTTILAVVLMTIALLGAAPTADAQGADTAVHPERHFGAGWDYASRGGSGTHGLAAMADMPMGETPIRLFTGGSFHSNSGATRVYAGGGPGFRLRANDELDVLAHVMLGMRYENMGEKYKFQPRFGGGFDYRFGRDAAFRVMAEYDGATHIFAGVSSRF